MIDVHSPRWTDRRAVVIAPCRRGDIVVDELDGEAILLDPGTGNTYRLNQTALTVWSRCDGRATTRDIVAVLTETYDVDFDTALDHVDQLIALFAEAGLLEGR